MSWRGSWQRRRKSGQKCGAQGLADYFSCIKYKNKYIMSLMRKCENAFSQMIESPDEIFASFYSNGNEHGLTV
jgi:hypothetical protein